MSQARSALSPSRSKPSAIFCDAVCNQIGKNLLPIWLQTASQNIAEGLQRDGLSADLAWDTAVDFVLGQSGHPRYQGPRYTQYKTKGLVRSPYETLF